ncbi:MAG TPA: metal-dependent hydrolase [Herpetosiphonaceae bacterium]|nr:metal-dependent hydrolase [Herpetosiphonaceae bacterium]
MPGGKTHMAIGVGVGLALGGALPLSISFPWQLGLTVGLATIGALAPDLDIADNELEELGRSEGQQAARRVRRAGRRAGLFWRAVTFVAGSVIWLVGELVSRVIEAIAALIQSVTTHRGLTHSLAGAAVVALVSIALSVLVTPTRNAWWGLAWSAGWASHLAADALTLSGLKLLQPWSEQRYWLAPRLLRFRVGTWPDALLGAVVPVLGLLALLLLHDVLGALTTALGG